MKRQDNRVRDGRVVGDGAPLFSETQWPFLLRRQLPGSQLQHREQIRQIDKPFRLAESSALFVSDVVLNHANDSYGQKEPRDNGLDRRLPRSNYGAAFYGSFRYSDVSDAQSAVVARFSSVRSATVNACSKRHCGNLRGMSPPGSIPTRPDPLGSETSDFDVARRGAKYGYVPNSGRRRANWLCSRCTIELCIWLTRLSDRFNVAPISFIVNSS
jgi:hypothetical protein